MDKMLFNSIIPRIRVFEGHLLSKEKLERMIHTTSAEGAMDFLLQEADYSQFIDEVNQPEDYEQLLTLELERVYKKIYAMVPIKEVVDLLTLKYDYHNLKVLVKEKLLAKDFSAQYIKVGSVELAVLLESFQKEDYWKLPPIMCKAITHVLEDFETTKDPQRIGLLFDEYMFEQLLALSKTIDDPFVQKFVRAQVDLANLQTLLRIQAIGESVHFLEEELIVGGNILPSRILSLFDKDLEELPNELFATDYAPWLAQLVEMNQETRTITYFEKMKADFFMKWLKEVKIVPFGVEPVIGYLHAKEVELTCLRIIMVGKINHIDRQKITERMRLVYE
ncbi:MAG: V-type ATP synthase subunit C [Streptococcaceae bacterium]|jgi:V/A-type H+-transporting ATPase subunit C|nr:V-type ATP synthase subunit C [Streptococcaceae bacterium]